MKLSVRPGFAVAFAAALAALVWWRVATAPERHIRRAMREIVSLAQKDSVGENPVLAAYGASRLSKVLAPRVELSAQEVGGLWVESRGDIVREFFAARTRASWISLSLRDLSVRFPARDRAVATAIATLDASFPEFGRSISGSRQVAVSFRRDEHSGEWLVTRATASAPTARVVDIHHGLAQE